MNKQNKPHEAGNINILPDMKRRPPLKYQQQKVLNIIQEKGAITLVELRTEHLIQQPGTRLSELYDMGYNVESCGRIPEFEYMGETFPRVAVWRAKSPIWPRPGYPEELANQSSPGDALPELSPVNGAPIQLDLFWPASNDQPQTQEAAE